MSSMEPAAVSSASSSAVCLAGLLISRGVQERVELAAYGCDPGGLGQAGGVQQAQRRAVTGHPGELPRQTGGIEGDVVPGQDGAAGALTEKVPPHDLGQLGEAWLAA